MNATVDGEFQRYAVESGAYIREHFFGPDPRLRKLVEHLSDEDLRRLPRGGHDYRKLYAAYQAATEHEGAPTVILAKTVKGWTLGAEVEGRNATHQIKKLTIEQLKDLRDRLHLHDEIPDAALDGDEPPYYRPPEDSPEHRYLMDRRRALDGPLPRRSLEVRRALTLPEPVGLRRVRRGVGHAGRVDHHGLHPPAAGPVPGRGLRPPGRAHHPRRGPHLRHGLRSSASSGSTPRRASSTSRSTTPCCSPTPRARTARSSRRASPRPAPWPASPPPAPPTPPVACPWCRSSSSIRCSGSSGWATSSGRPPTPGPGAS